jgi:ADP-heptose:LPS heptosyltransferase
MHCGSGGREKNWPSDNYEALMRMIVEDHRMTCIVFRVGGRQWYGARFRSAERHAE